MKQEPELSGILRWFEPPAMRVVWGFAILSAARASFIAYSDGFSWLLVARFLLVWTAIDVARDARWLPEDRQLRGLGQAIALLCLSMMLVPD